MVPVNDGSICLTLSLSLTKSRPQKIVPTRNTAPLAVQVSLMRTLAISHAQMDSRLHRLSTRLRAHAVRLRSSVMVSAWLQVPAPQASHLERRRGAGLAAALAQTSVPDGRPAASLALVPAHGSASTQLVILKAVSLCLSLTRHSSAN